MSHVLVGCGEHGHEELDGADCSKRVVRTKRIERDARQGEPEGLPTEGDETKDAVDTALQPVWDQSHAIAHLRHVVDRVDQEGDRRQDPDRQDIGCEDIGKPDSCPNERRRTYDNPEAQPLLQRARDEGPDNAADAADGEDQSDAQV